MLNAQNQNQFQIPNNFSEKFGNDTHLFLRQFLVNDNVKDICETIDGLLQDNPEIEEAKLIYNLAEYIRNEYVELGLHKMADLPITYSDIICEAVYSCDCYEIAKEIYKQYKSFNKIEARKELIDC